MSAWKLLRASLINNNHRRLLFPVCVSERPCLVPFGVWRQLVKVEPVKVTVAMCSTVDPKSFYSAVTAKLLIVVARGQKQINP